MTALLSEPSESSADSGPRVLVIDNYDSFTYNLVQHMSEVSGADIRVFRNDRISTAGIREEAPSHLVISPGPGTPADAGVSLEAIRIFAGIIPILGVCLGHQAIAQVFGGEVVRGRTPVHGKTSLIHHDGCGLFSSLPQPFSATRYHSLVVHPAIPRCLLLSAWTEDGVVMGIRHRHHAIEGLQFHPESVMTSCGKAILLNFLRLSSGHQPVEVERPTQEVVPL
jgi:para-aminobenzoate synthetase component II